MNAKRATTRASTSLLGSVVTTSTTTTTIFFFVAIAVLIVVPTDVVAQVTPAACCRAIAWQPNCGSLDTATSLTSMSWFVANAPIGQSLASGPWPHDGWYVSVQELRVTDGLPYDIALVRLNTSTPNIVGQSTLVNDIDAMGLSVFQSFAHSLRAGTTNVQFHFENTTNPVWVSSVHLHRAISVDQKVSARLELYSAVDHALLYQRQWLWDTTLVSNVITHSIPVDTVHGPVSRMRLSFWGSGSAAVGEVRVCQQCVSASATPSQTPTRTAPASATPTAPPTIGHACQTGAQGVCALGTWQRNDAGSLICVMSTLPSHELCDGLDNDCDGWVDEDFAGRVIECGTGVCYRSVPMCSPHGQLAQCTPGTPQAQEVCDGLDNDCNGLVDDALPTLSCGVGACYRQTPSCINGTVQHCTPGTPEPELCDGLDNDCDGAVDENNVCAQPNYAIAKPLILPVLRCVTSSSTMVAQCAPRWNVVAITDELVNSVSFSTYTSTDTDKHHVADNNDDNDVDELGAQLSVITLLTNGSSSSNDGAVSHTLLSNGQHEYYWTNVMSNGAFSCVGSTSWCLMDLATTLSFSTQQRQQQQRWRNHQCSTADRFSPECSTNDNDAALDVPQTFNNNGGVLLPTLDGCVQRLDGYCMAVFGYYYAPVSASSPRLDMPVNTATNYVSSTPSPPPPPPPSGIVVNNNNIDQAQPVRFYAGRAHNVLMVRVECATPSLAQWSVQWQLGNAVARATAQDICLDSGNVSER